MFDPERYMSFIG